MNRGRIGLRAGGLVVLTAAVAGTGLGFAIHAATSGEASSDQSSPAGLHGQVTWKRGERPAPGFQLADQSGQPVSLTSLRGRSVLLTFFSSRCGASCAAEARTLRVALRLVPMAARPALLIVSLDPVHDTPGSTRAAVARWGLADAAEWHWLLGSRRELAPLWRTYRVVPGGPAGRSSPVYLIDRNGFERAGLLYPFPPGWPAGDLSILAGEG